MLSEKFYLAIEPRNYYFFNKMTQKYLQSTTIFYRLNMTEDLTLVCDDKLASLTGREYSDGGQTVDNLLSVSVFLLTLTCVTKCFVCPFFTSKTEYWIEVGYF